MPWYASVADALAANGARHSLGEVATTHAAPESAWAGHPVAEPVDDEVRELVAFIRSVRYQDAAAALGRWGRLALLDPERNVIAEVNDSTTLTDLLRSRSDVTPWVPTDPGRPGQVIAAAVLDVSAFAAAARLPAVKPGPDEPAKPGYVRHSGEARATAIEQLPPTPRIRSRLISPGESLAEVGAEFLRPPSRQTLCWYCWQKPEGWRFKPHARGIGLELANFVPAQGATIRGDETSYEVDWSFSRIGHELDLMPDWIAEKLGKRA